MPLANWDVLVKYPVAIPPLPLLFQFNEFVQNTLAQIHNLIFKNRNLRQIRDLLLPKLISGEIDVKNLDITSRKIAAYPLYKNPMSHQLIIKYSETFPDALQQTREQFEQEAFRGKGSQTL